jgi:hypothetical protein
MTAGTTGGEQFEFGVLAFVCSVLRTIGVPDPINDASSADFIAEFGRWYRGSRLPSLFRSRLARREARIAGGEGRTTAAVAALARATWYDPAWPLRRFGVNADVAAEARAWAEAWARMKR